MQGVDYINIIDGPSNGNAMLLLFEEAVELQNNDGSAILERGDTVIMDSAVFTTVNWYARRVRSASLVSASLLATLEYMWALLSSSKVLPETQPASCLTANRNCNFGRMSWNNSGTSSAYFRHCGYLQWLKCILKFCCPSIAY